MIDKSSLSALADRPDLVAGIIATIVIYGVLAASPTAAPLVPVIYLLATAAGALLPRRALWVGGGTVVGAELFLSVLGRQSLGSAVTHVGFVLAFGGLGVALLRVELLAYRRAAGRRLRKLIQGARADARAFRIGRGQVDSRREDDSMPPVELSARRELGSVEVVRAALGDIVEIARRSTGAHTAVLLLPDVDSSVLRVHAATSIERPPRKDFLVNAHEGALGAVVRTKAPVHFLKSGSSRGLGDLAPESANAMLGVPLVRDDSLDAVLVMYGTDETGFTEEQQNLASVILRQADRSMEAERIVHALDRSSYEHERLFEAIALLNEALGVEMVASRLLEAASRIKPLGFGAVTVFDEEKGENVVVAVSTESESMRAELTGHRFKPNEGGLVSMAMKAGQPMPFVPLHRQSSRGGERRVFGESLPIELRSIKVFPLVVHGQALGTLVLGDESPLNELSSEEAFMIQIAAVHGATTLANAQMYKRMETMATTDPLTNLVNRRRFMELADEALARADRFGRQVSLLLIDADHFKRINDTYGHSVGDVALHSIASLLRQEARRTDVVARFGGEEFVVLADETDRPGALVLAERIRAKIASSAVRGSFGDVTVTVSIGTSTWPSQATSKEQLLERADQALYQAKHSGRNRVEQWGEAHCIAPRSQAIATEDVASTTSVRPA